MRTALSYADGRVMTVAAGICSLAVIKGHDHRLPHVGGVTGLAQLARNWMSGRFIGASADAIVAAGTVARLPGHGAVIKDDLRPVGGVMAGIAGLGRGNVGGALAYGDRAVMAVITSRRGLAVVERYDKRAPTGAGGMTGLAHIRGLRMTGGFVSGIGSSMTARAGRRCLVVWEW